MSLALLAVSCQHHFSTWFEEIADFWSPAIPDGLQEGYLAYIPAQIAVLPCRSWPLQAPYVELPISTIKPEEQEEICRSIETFVISQFKNQPYLRGFTPTAVGKLLAKAQAPQFLDGLTSLWVLPQPQEQAPPDNAREFYVYHLATHVPWLHWIQELSQHTRHSDAVLFSFLSFAQEQLKSEGQIRFVRRGLGVIFLLVDTTHGRLIWSKSKDGLISTAGLSQDPTPPVPVPWAQVLERVLLPALWDDFPGHLLIAP